MFRPLRSRSPSPSGLPLNTKPTPRYNGSPRRGYLSFFGTAALVGIIFHLLFFGFGGNEYVQQVPVLKDWMPTKTYCPPTANEALEYEYAPPVHTIVPPASRPTIPIPPSSSSPPSREKDDQEQLSVEEIGAIVSRASGFLARDYSLGLGWNNMRYIIESALLQATLLNRTLVLPSFVYARSCEWELNACAAFAKMVNKGDAIGWGEWRDLPIEKQMGWRIPMTMMLDLPHLRQKHNVITIEEYLRYQGIDPGKEWSNGAWHRSDYLKEGMSIFVVKNNEYDPEGMVRVDDKSVLTKKTGSHHETGEKRAMPPIPGSGRLHNKLVEAIRNELTLEWPRVLIEVADFVEDTGDIAQVEAVLAKEGWAVVHTFAGSLGMDYLKSVVEPIRQATPLSRIHGWVDDYGHIKDDILVIEGEIHLNRKPGGMRFTSINARNSFADSVLHGLRPIQRVRDLAAKVHDRMRDKVDGRMWMAGHMRRGDFVQHGWAMEGQLEAHFDRIKTRLGNGRKTLQTIHDSGSLETYEVPNVVADGEQLLYDPPKVGDPFFLATDERSADGIKYIKEHGAILIGDLLTPEDRREFGWGIMITDVLALVEQSVMARGYFFYAHAMSSVAGGAVNLRAARGADPRAALID